MTQHIAGCHILLASDAPGGKELAAAHRPDCAIIDLDVAPEGGVTLCRQLKLSKARFPFPVLLYTSEEPDEAQKLSVFEAGADEFLYHRFDNMDMVAKVRVLLRIKRAEDELRSANKRLADLAGERSKTMREYEERFRLLFHASSDAILVLELASDGESGAFVDVNDVACELTRYDRDEFLELGLKGLFPKSLMGNIQGRIESIVQHKQVFFETMVQDRDGKAIPVAMHTRVFDYGPRPIIIAVVRDLRRAGEATPEEADAETRYRSIAAQTGQMIYDCRIRTGEIRWGGAMTQVTGFKPEELAGFVWDKWKAHVHPKDREENRQVFKEAIDALGTYRLEYRIRHKSGQYRHVEDLGVVLAGEDGSAYRILGTIKDTTARVQTESERRRLEREMQHSQKLESLGVLAGGIAHDFNNILAAIIGLTDLSLQDLEPTSDTYQDLEEALQAAHRAKELVQQILAFSRQTGEERSDLFLHIVVREALKLLRASLPATIEIIDSVDVHSGVVLANPTQMHQVIMNYCTNAAHAMREKGGVLEVRLVDVDLDVRAAQAHPKLLPGPYVLLSVHDTGHGMEPRVLNRIFDPFFTTKGPGEGTGMGLAVVHGIVMDHGGAATVESKPGRGTTIYTYLPRVQGRLSETQPEPEPVDGGKERILFVDDEEGLIHFGQSFLPRLGYAAVFCKNGHEALKVFAQDPSAFDLVITDNVMPRMTGVELAETIRELRKDIPIILFTGFSEDITDARARKAGIQEIVLKPVLGSDLAKRIRRLLDHKANGPTKGAS